MLISSGPHQQWESSRPRVLFLSHRQLFLLVRPSASASSPPAFPAQASPESSCSRRVARFEVTERVSRTRFFSKGRICLTDSYQNCASDPRTIYLFGFIYSAWRENVNTLPVNEALRPDAGLDPASKALV